MADDVQNDLPTDATPDSVETTERVDVDRLIEETRAAGFDPAALTTLAEQFGLSELQHKLAVGLLRGLNQTESARQAGYAGDDATLRSAGSKAANSPKVKRFLDAAKAMLANKPAADMTNEEKRRYLSQIARSSNDNTRVRAILGHSQLEREDRERQASEAGGDDPVSILVEIAELDADCLTIARGLARKNNLITQFEAAWSARKVLTQAVVGSLNGGAMQPSTTNDARG